MEGMGINRVFKANHIWLEGSSCRGLSRILNFRKVKEERSGEVVVVIGPQR